MTTYTFDIEANGLYDQVTKVHVVAFYDLEQDKMSVSQSVLLSDPQPELPVKLQKGDRIIAHNGLGYDLSVLRKLCGLEYTVGKQDVWCGVEVEFIDTFQLSQFLWPDRPGGHSLENLAKLAGTFKQEYTGGFDVWSQEMEDYCIQDTKATAKVYEYLIKEAKEKYGEVQC